MARARPQPAAAEQAPDDQRQLSRQQVTRLVERAEAGDQQALAQLRPLFEHDQALWARWTSKAVTSEEAWIDRLIGQQLLTRQVLEQQLAIMRRELEGAQPTPLERLLVERIIACWLQVQFFELRVARPNQDRTATHWDHDEKSLDRAQRRLLEAVRTLGQIRRLALPALQLNIARTQLNQLTVAPMPDAPLEPPAEPA